MYRSNLGLILPLPTQCGATRVNLSSYVDVEPVVQNSVSAFAPIELLPSTRVFQFTKNRDSFRPSYPTQLA